MLQQPFAFQGLLSIISGGGEEKEEGMRSEYMEPGWRELIMEFGLDGHLSVCLSFYISAYHGLDGGHNTIPLN